MTRLTAFPCPPVRPLRPIKRVSIKDLWYKVGAMAPLNRPAVLFNRLPGAVRAGIFILVAGGFFVVMMALARRLSADGLHMLIVVFWRAAFGVAFMGPWLARRRLVAMRTNKLPGHAARTLVSYGGLLCSFYAATMIPLADITAISFTRPIIASILAILLLAEAARARRWFATMVGFCGALIIIRPGFAEVNPGVGLVLISVVLGSFGAILAKYLVRTDPPDAVAAYMMIILTPLALAPALFVWTWPTSEQFAWLVLLGALGTVSQRALTRAYHAADASVVQSLDFMRLPVAALIGFVLFSELPDIWIWLGGAIIVGSSVYIARVESQAERRDSG